MLIEATQIEGKELYYLYKILLKIHEIAKMYWATNTFAVQCMFKRDYFALQ